VDENEWEQNYYELALKVSGAVQAARWSGVAVREPREQSSATAGAAQLGYIYSFNGPQSLFVDTMRTTRILGVAWQLDHALMHENDKRADLLKRSVLHGLTTSQFIIFHGDTDHSYGFRKIQLEPSESEMRDQHPSPDLPQEVPLSAFPKFKAELRNGSVLIAAITSCTNTSNPSVMLAAGLLARKAVERGLTVNPVVKTSLAPGSRVVSDYLAATGLQPYLDQLGFNLVGYGCTTCIGNSGPLPEPVATAIERYLE